MPVLNYWTFGRTGLQSKIMKFKRNRGKCKVPVPGDLIWPYGVHFLRNLAELAGLEPVWRTDLRPDMVIRRT